MSLLTQAKIAQDINLIQRIAAAAAITGAPDSPPTGWALKEIWGLAATDGWVDAYNACDATEPGSCPNAITDVMIVTAVQSRVDQIGAERPPLPDYSEDPHPAE